MCLCSHSLAAVFRLTIVIVYRSKPLFGIGLTSFYILKPAAVERSYKGTKPYFSTTEGMQSGCCTNVHRKQRFECKMSIIQSFSRLLSAGASVLVLSACSSGAFESSSEVQSLSETGATSQGQSDVVATQLMSNDCLTSELDDELLVALNAARAEARNCGSDFYEAVGPVTWNCKLEAAGLTHSTDMGDNNFFSHTGSNGLRVGSRATQAGYSWSMVGENIAAGFYSVDTVMQGWLDSPSHCSAIMNGYYEEGAVAVYIADNADYEVYWTMVLGHPVQ